MRRLLTIFRTTGRLTFVLVLLIITFIYAMFQGGFVSWFLFYSFLPFGFYSLCLVFYPLSKVEVTRSINGTEFIAGEKYSGSITLKRRFSFPLFYVIVEDILPNKLQSGKMIKEPKFLLIPWLKRTHKYEYVISELTRGEHTLQGIRMKVSDLFGLVEKEIFFPIDTKIVVYPKYEEITFRPIENRYDHGLTSSHAKFQRDMTIVNGVREYQSGDRFSYINWKATARRNNLMTKEFEQQRNHDVIVIMDRSTQQQFEQVVSFTASIVRAILKKGSQIAFVSIGKERSFFPFTSGEAQYGLIYHHLAKVQPDSTIPLSKIAETELLTITQPASIIFITSKATTEVIKAVNMLAKRQAGVLLVIVKNKTGIVSLEENEYIEGLKKQNVIVKVIYEGHFADVFLR